MIKSVSEDTFIQVINDTEVELSYSDLKIKDGAIHLPIVGDKLEVLFLTDRDDEHSQLVACIFAKVASIK